MALLAAARRASALPLQRAPVLLPRRPTLSSARAISFWGSSPSSSSSKDYEDAMASLFRRWASVRVQVDTLGAMLQEFRLQRALGSTVLSRSPAVDLPDLLAQIAATTDHFPFEISENKRGDAITLTRALNGEQIEVVVSMPTLDENDDDNKNKASLASLNENAKEDQEGEPKTSTSTMYLAVTISKGDGSSLEFACFALPDKIQICTMNMELPTSKENVEIMATYDGFEGLDENLRKSFHEYLELRGITPEMMNLLRGYLSKKVQCKHTLWMINLQAFLRKTD